MSDETEHPSIEFEGRRYERRQGVWYDALTHMKAPAHLSQRIDTSAKRDPALWERCHQQDFSDDPKTRGRVLIDVSELIDLGLFPDSEPHGSKPRSAPNRTRRARIGENVKISFKNIGRDQVVHCDLEPGWHETGSGGFSRSQIASSFRRAIPCDAQPRSSSTPSVSGVDELLTTARWCERRPRAGRTSRCR